MSTGKKDKNQFELDLTLTEPSDNVTMFTSRLPDCQHSTATVFDIRNTMIVAQAAVRKEKAERVLRAVGLMG